MPGESKVKWCKYAVNGTCNKTDARCSHPHVAVTKLNKLYRSVGFSIFINIQSETSGCSIGSVDIKTHFPSLNSVQRHLGLN